MTKFKFLIQNWNKFWCCTIW